MRSAVSSAAARALDVEHRPAVAPLALGAPGARAATSGSSARNVASAASRPKTTPGCFCVIRARARAPGRHGRPRGDVAGADVLVERAAHDRVQVHGPGRYGTAALEHDLAVARAVAAVLLDAVAAGPAVDDVGAAADRADRVVARTAEDAVAAEAAVDRVAAVAADQRVVAAAALELVGAEAADEAVVARAAEQRVDAAAAVEAVAAAGALEEVVAAAAE